MLNLGRVFRRSLLLVSKMRYSSIAAKNPKVMRHWFMGCATMTAGAIAIGGLTRLTESGLSMTEWKLVDDMVLPGSEEKWIEKFEQYKNFPEWIRLNKDRELTLEQFKFIYKMEYLHRLWGRATGVIFLLPLPFLWKNLTRKGRFASIGIGGLLGLQGVLGWIMVRSGLDENLLGEDGVPRVSHYRLAAHLSAAVVLYAAFVWSALDCRKYPVAPKTPGARATCLAMLGLISLTIVSGALVAGLDAGMIYDTFPLMGNTFVPDDYRSPLIESKLKNMLENPSAVQFNHRILGMSTVCMAAYTYLRYYKVPTLRSPCTAVLHSSLLQLALGIGTVLYGVPVWLASAHQVNSIILLTCVLRLLKRLPK